MANESVNYFSYMSDLIVGENSKGISIRDLELVKENSISLAQKINISLAEIILKKNWYSYKEEYYYYKGISSAFRIVNELLGEYLSKYMMIPTIEYTLALDFGKVVGLLSKNFREKGKRYYNAACVNEKYLRGFSKAIRNRKIDDLRKMLDRLIMKDFYSCMTDKNRNTLISMTRFKRVSLEESYDYEFSFIDERDTLGPKSEKKESFEYDTYYNPLFLSNDGNRHCDPITYDTLKGMMEYDEYLVDQLKRIMDFDIRKSINDIEEDNGITIGDELKKYYIDFDEKRKNELKRGLGH